MFSAQLRRARQRGDRAAARAIAERSDPGQRRLLYRYSVWHLVRRLRARIGGAHATRDQVAAAQRNIKAAVALLDWLTARGLTLDGARQGDLEAWLASAQAIHRTDAGNFVRWARRPVRRDRHRGPLGAGRPPDPRRDSQTRRPAGRAARRPLRSAGFGDQPPYPRSPPRRRPRSTASPWPRARRPARTARHAGQGRSPQPGAATPPSTARTAPHGCSPAASPVGPSALSAWPNAFARPASAPGQPGPPRCSSSPPTCRCRPGPHARHPHHRRGRPAARRSR